jgi:dephospho-CoA kinase
VKVFGLTGGIASGKSTVARRFRALGLPVIDADELARDVVAPGTEGLAAVVEAFGRDVLLPDGTLDRKTLGALVFENPEQRRRLNGLLHPRIAALGAERSAALAASGCPLACYEAALLVENGLAAAFRPLVVVAAPDYVQIARTCQRDGVTEQEAKARLAAQMPLAEKVRQADIVIENTGTLAELQVRADEALRAVCLATQTSPDRYAWSVGSS